MGEPPRPTTVWPQLPSEEPGSAPITVRPGIGVTKSRRSAERRSHVVPRRPAVAPPGR